MLTSRIVFGGDLDGLRFRRVMAGEYVAQARNGWTYSIYRKCEGCTQCDHSHECWLAEMSPAYGVREEIGRFRTLTDARIAAAQHAIDEGLLEAVSS